MKIAVTSTGPTLDDQVEVRFGRCAYFLMIDTETMQAETVENPNIALGGGAGIQSAQLMSEKGVTCVLTGNCGPNAFNVFGQAGIQVIVGVSGPVRLAVEQFKTGALTSASGPNVASHFGIGSGQESDPVSPYGSVNPGMGNPGMGMGRGRGMGRGGGGRGMGRGGGGGRGMGMPWTGLTTGFPIDAGPMNADSDLAELKRQTRQLELQKEQLNQRIHQLETGRRAVAVVAPDKCSGCGICVDVCPVGAIKVTQRQAAINEELCSGCAACVSVCPREAIRIVHKETGA